VPDDAKPDYTTLDFPDPPADRPYVYVNMVMSTDGKVTIEGTERGLGTPIDQRLMRELRVSADVVLNGASTLRASGTSSRLGDPELVAIRTARGLPEAPIAAVMSGSANLPLDALFFTGTDFRAIVYVGADAPQDRIEAIRATSRDAVQLPAENPVPWMLHHMRTALDARYVLLEGGPTLNGQLLEHGLVDEYFLTLGPRIVSGNATLTPFRSDRDTTLDAVTQLNLISATPNPATSELYLRYRVQR
jgi:2,5-diamino-6-(ribosylamino)-4(3H)-pyrimidinone 5'-phosphate reductase